MAFRISGMTALALGAAALVVSACGSDGERRERGVLADLPPYFMGPDAVVFFEYDANRDKLVDGAEFDAGARASFAAADGDNSGRISAIELGDWCHANLGNRDALSMLSFGVMTDQQLDASGFIGGLRNRFAKLDRNRDNVLQRSELWTQMPALQFGPRERPPVPTAPTGDGSGGGGPGWRSLTAQAR